MASDALSNEALAEWRSSEQVENGIASTSPPYWEDDDDDYPGPRPSELFVKNTWKIEKFSQINKRELRSSVFETGGYKWYILIYPQGCDVCNHLSLFLCVADHDKLLPGWGHFAQFTIAVTNKDPKKSKYSDTLHRFWKKEHDWGWKKFMELSKVLDGFVENDTLVIKAQVQVIRERADRPFRCLDSQYRRELVRVYLSNVEQICKRFVEEKRGKFGKLIEDKAKWSSFCSFWSEIDQNSRRLMSKEKSDPILKLAVKQFFVEKEVASTLVMDSLYSGLKSLQVQTKNKKPKGKRLDTAQLPIPIIRLEKDTFILVDDVLALLQRVAVEPLPPKDDKGPQNRTKDGGSGDDFSKESIERDERRLTELGRKTIELFVLSHIFSSKIEVEYQEAVALKRQEELIREEEAEWMTGIEQKAKRGASEKDKKSKKKQAKQKKNNRKLKDKGKDEIAGATVAEEEDKPQQQIPNDGIKGLLTQDAELLLDTPEDVSDASDSVNCVLDEAHALADSDDRDSSPVNYDTDTSEAQPPIGFAVHSGFLNGAKKSPSMIDDSSSTCSTDSLPSVVYKDDLLQNQKSQKSPTRGKNKQGHDLTEVTGSEAANSPVAGSCKMNELESNVAVISLQDRVKSVEQHVSKKLEDVTLQKDASAKDEVDPKTLKGWTAGIPSSKSNLKVSTSSDPAISRRSPLDKTLNTDKAVNSAASSASPKPFGHTIGTQKPAEKVSRNVQEPISTGKAINGPGTSLTNDKPVHHHVSKPPPVRQVPVSADKSASQPVSRPLSAPLVPGPRSSANLPVVSMVNAAPFLPRSVSAAGRLGPDASAPATQSVVPQSYRNAIMGNPATSSSTTFSQPHSPNLTYSQPPHSPIISAAPMFLPHSSDSSVSARNGFSLGMANHDLSQNGSQWMGINSSSRGLHNDHSLLNDIQNIDLHKPKSHDHSSNYEFPAKHRQANGILADEFPHLDIINDLLDDEHGMQSASEVSPLFPSVSNGPNHLNRQFTYPGGSLDTSSCRFEPSRSYHDEFPFSYGGGGAHFDRPREMVARQPNLQPYMNFDELTHNQWQMGGSSEISYPGLQNMDNDGYHQYPNYSNNLMMGANGYTVYRPSNGH